jgi:hypothetical protein
MTIDQRPPEQPRENIGPATIDYAAENRRRKEALRREEEFIEREVLGQGAESPEDMGVENIQSDMEQSIEESESEEQ